MYSVFFAPISLVFLIPPDPPPDENTDSSELRVSKIARDESMVNTCEVLNVD